MIIITCALMQDKIIKYLETSNIGVEFTRKDGINIYFKNVSEVNDDVLSGQVKAELKKDTVLGSLVFKVNTKEYA